jgi:lipopolysaccharide export system permease protein
MTVLALPALVQLVAPIAFLVGAIATLNGLTKDSELPVISGAGASRKAVNRPIILLGVAVMLAVAFAHHVLTPASLLALRSLLTRVQTQVIATLVKEGGFHEVTDGLTMHVRSRAPDGSFQGVFIDDQRDPDDSLQYTAAEGVLLEQPVGSFLVLQDGELIREQRVGGQSSVIAFETYALDLSQIGAPGAAAIYRARERSTFYLLDPPPDDAVLKENPGRLRAEIHDRMTAPLYAIAFALIALAFLARPRTSRQESGFAIAATVLICLSLRVGGYAAVQAARGSAGAIPLMYLIPITGIALGAYGTLHSGLLKGPRIASDLWATGIAALSGIVRPRRAGVARTEGR